MSVLVAKMPPIHEAVVAADMGKINDLLDEDEACMDAVDELNRTPLIL